MSDVFDIDNTAPVLISAYIQHRLYKEGFVKSATFNYAKDFDSLRRKITYLIRSLSTKRIKEEGFESKIINTRVDSNGGLSFSYSYDPIRETNGVLYKEALQFVLFSYINDLIVSTPEYAILNDHNAFYCSFSARGGSLSTHINYLYYYTSVLGISERLRRSSIVGSDNLKEKVDFLYTALINMPKIMIESVKFKDVFTSYYTQDFNIDTSKRIPLIYMFYLAEHIRANDSLVISATESLINLKLLYEANRSLLIDTVYEPEPTILNDFMFAYFRVSRRSPIPDEVKARIDAFSVYIKSLCSANGVTIVTLGS